MVGLGGFEPPTSPLSGVRSNQLSYRPNPPGLAPEPRVRPYYRLARRRSLKLDKIICVNIHQVR